jgi:hypothetical protein
MREKSENFLERGICPWMSLRVLSGRKTRVGSNFLSFPGSFSLKFLGTPGYLPNVAFFLNKPLLQGVVE